MLTNRIKKYTNVEKDECVNITLGGGVMKVRNVLIGCLVLAFNGICITNDIEDWTWLYKKHITSYERGHYRNEIAFSREGVPKFSQLVLSWNAFRPESGHYSFWAQVRNAHTKRWGSPHKVIEWGNGIQKSYYSKGDLSKGCYVRVELPKKELGDGFKIKVKTHNGADYSGLEMLSACISNLRNFAIEKISRIASLPSVRVAGVPQSSQMLLNHERAAHLCSPTSMSMLVGYLKKEEIDPVAFAAQSYDQGLDAYGSWPFNTAAAFEQCDGKVNFYVKRLPSFTHLYNYLRQDIPVVVSVRGRLNGAPKPYNNGHLMVVVGWDGQKNSVIVHDPAVKGDGNIVKEYDAAGFTRAWASSNNLAYVAQPRFV